MEKSYKRKCRALSQETKDKISRALTGRKKSSQHKEHISQGLISYWKQVPQ